MALNFGRSQNVMVQRDAAAPHAPGFSRYQPPGAVCPPRASGYCNGKSFFPSGEFFGVLCRDWVSWEPHLAPDVLNGGYSGGHCPSLKN